MKVSPRSFCVYILTSQTKSVLYIGVTNDLPRRIMEHYLNRGNSKTFSGRYYCYLLVYYEIFRYVNNAIAREKEIKKWDRKKKEDLIYGFNPDWDVLNREFFDKWPPDAL